MKTPNHAAKVWFADNRYYIELDDFGQSHTIHCSGQQLLFLLQQRTQSSKLCTGGDLTQWQIDRKRPGSDDLVAQYLAAGFQPAQKRNRKYSKEERKSALELLQRAGLR